MSSNGNGLGNGKNGKKRRRRILWAAIAVAVLGGGGYGVKAALSPSRTDAPLDVAGAPWPAAAAGPRAAAVS